MPFQHSSTLFRLLANVSLIGRRRDFPSVHASGMTSAIEYVPCRALHTSASHPAAPGAAAEEAGKPDLATAGPPAPRTGAACAACPSSVERWAGPGGRLSRCALWPCATCLWQDDIICVARFIDECLERVSTSAGPPVGDHASDQP